MTEAKNDLKENLIMLNENADRVQIESEQM